MPKPCIHFFSNQNMSISEESNARNKEKWSWKARYFFNWGTGQKYTTSLIGIIIPKERINENVILYPAIIILKNMAFLYIAITIKNILLQ